MFIKQSVAFGVFALLLANSSLTASPVYHVTNNADFGPNSLRDGLSSGVSVIILDESVAEIAISDTLKYTDKLPLTIIGSGQTILGLAADKTLLEISNGADLTISNINFTVNEHFSLTNQGGGKGIFVNIPNDREGVVSLILNNVSVANVGQHGIHLSDCVVDRCGADSSGGLATVYVNLTAVTIDNVGYGHFDSDGIRVDERNEGDIIFNAVNSVFRHVGADGVELDEGNNGQVIVNLSNVSFEANGGYCAGISNLYAPEDAACVEYDDGKLVLDLDDGIDVDEAGDGSIFGQLNQVVVSHNYDEGLDFDEEGDGSINVNLAHIEAVGNSEEGIKFSEKEDGDIEVELKSSLVLDNHDDGIQFKEEDSGNIHITVHETTSLHNTKKDLKVSEAGEGRGELLLQASQINSIKTSDDVLLLKPL